MTSDNYVGLTRLLVESLRVFHPTIPVDVYALDTNWKEEHTARLSDLSVNVKLMREIDVRNRRGANGKAVHNLQKLDALMDVAEPFLYLDADILVLRPLDAVFAAIERDGWFTSSEGTRLVEYTAGELAQVSGLTDLPRDLGSFNSGVLGCDPAKFREVFALARDWGGRISGNFLGDQGLMNLAYYKLHRSIPTCRGNQFNGGFTKDGLIEPWQTILHFGGPRTITVGKTKLQVQIEVWEHWPRGVNVQPLRETEFWRTSLPHPWAYMNQVNRPVHRRFVRDMRDKSRALRDVPWLLIRDEYEAFLLDRDVLRAADRFWAEHAERFARVPCVGTYHLPGPDGASGVARRQRRRFWMDLRSRLVLR